MSYFYYTKAPWYMGSSAGHSVTVEIDSGITSIYSGAFQNCQNLVSITIPDTVTSIGDDAFRGVENIMFYCSLNSLAAVYAIEHNYPFIIVGEDVKIASPVIDELLSYYKVNYDGVSTSGYLSMLAGYAFKESASHSNANLVFNIPENAELIESTLKINGVLCRDYTFEDGVLTIPVSASEGSVRFSLKPLRYELFTSYGKITYDDGTTNRTEVLGVVHAELPVLSIIAKGETSALSIEVNGVTIPNSSVDLYVNGQKQQTVTANKAGDYYATLNLDTVSDGKRYVLSASTLSNGSTITSETTVIYREGSPVLTEFIMAHNGQTFNLHSLDGTKPVVTFAPGVDFRFTAKFDNVSAIDSVYFVSTRNNLKKYLKGQWDEESQSFIAEGLFDPDNASYVPGSISIEYLRKSGTISFTEGYDFTTDECVNSLPASWKDAEVDILENSDNCSDVTIHIPEQDTSLHITAKKESLPRGLTPENAESEGYYATTDSYGKKVFTKYYEKPGECRLEILDFQENGAGQIINWTIGEMSKTGEVITNIYELSSAFYDGLVNEAEYASMRNDIQQSKYLSESQKSEALWHLNMSRSVNALSTLGKWSGVAVGIAAGIALGPIGGFAVACAVSLTDTMFDWMREYEMNQMLLMMYELQKFGFGFRWAIDPSGYVYDSTTDERVSGVTVTAYWIPYDEDQDDFWDSIPGDSEYGEVWDSLEYSQLNPLSTDLSGCYSWDVPEGWWRVKYEKDGYETTWSDWMTVPPIQTDVNIGMVSTDSEDYAISLTESSTTSASVTLSSQTSTDSKVLFVIAAYNSNGQMIAICADDVTLSSSEDATLSLSFSESDFATEVRAFILDMNTYVPLRGGWIRHL